MTAWLVQENDGLRGIAARALAAERQRDELLDAALRMLEVRGPIERDEARMELWRVCTRISTQAQKIAAGDGHTGGK